MKAQLPNGTPPFAKLSEQELQRRRAEEEKKESEVAREINNRCYEFGRFSFSTDNFQRKRISDFEGSLNQFIMRELRRKTYAIYLASKSKKEQGELSNELWVLDGILKHQLDHD